MKLSLIDYLVKENNNINIHFKKNPIKNHKKILIIGSNGLVGLNILSALINLKKKFKENITIHCLSKSKLIYKISGAENKKKISFLKMDITKKIPHGKYDLIIFSAGYSSPNSFLEDKSTLLIPSLGLINAFKTLKKNGKLIFFSSSEIYNGRNSSFLETYSGNTNFDDKRATYINGKKFGETLCYNKIKDGYSVIILRLSLAYGPGSGLNDKRVLNDFIIKGLNKKKIKMLDRGQNLRKYIFITDVMIYIFKLLEKKKIGAFNITGKSKIRIFDLAKSISDKVGAKLLLPKKINSIPGAPKNVNISVKKLNKVYKLNLINLKKGIGKTIRWYKFLLKQ